MKVTAIFLDGPWKGIMQIIEGHQYVHMGPRSKEISVFNKNDGSVFENTIEESTLYFATYRSLNEVTQKQTVLYSTTGNADVIFPYIIE